MVTSCLLSWLGCTFLYLSFLSPYTEAHAPTYMHGTTLQHWCCSHYRRGYPAPCFLCPSYLPPQISRQASFVAGGGAFTRRHRGSTTRAWLLPPVITHLLTKGTRFPPSRSLLLDCCCPLTAMLYTTVYHGMQVLVDGTVDDYLCSSVSEEPVLVLQGRWRR